MLAKRGYTMFSVQPGLSFISGKHKKVTTKKLEVKTRELAEEVKRLVNQALKEYKSTIIV